MTVRLAFILPVLLAVMLAGCAQTEFDATPVGSAQPLRVANSQDTDFYSTPLQYRMRADESHLIFWIDNPTADPITLIGDKSEVVDPEGTAHPLRGQLIAPGSSVKEVFPPLAEPSDAEAASSSNSVGPYDRSGFIPVPGVSVGPARPDTTWQWDDQLDIQLNLFFDRNGQTFEQHFSIQRIRK